ncbi:hypothetical protein OG342_38760 [Streptomyces bobili]|uniref:hypothetical protein n=1 Tax=Streptomyces bobili TaxID=67280 RepID=UPI0022575C07|nr:hypothetical protein [Streptomyces bobili]MCX5528727.1 hypothetical protein [Streptomyces bobili]
MAPESIDTASIDTESTGAETTEMAAKNGTVVFYDKDRHAARHALKDAVAVAPTAAEALPKIGAAGWTALATGMLNLVGSAQTGVSVAQTVLANMSAKTGQVEITITNNASLPVTLFNYRPTKLDVSNVPNLLSTGESDVFTLTRQSLIDDSSSVELDFMIGDGVNCAPFRLWFAYTNEGNPGRWKLSALVDGSGKHNYPKALQMFGFTYSGNTGFPSFSVYTAPIETGSGMLSVIIYDKASS